jgi:hydroxyacylglutathione hydrolase
VVDRLYFRQLLAGRDYARDDPVARQMVNFAYLIGDRETGDALAVDPAYSVRELVETAAADGMRITGALVTHYHPDHVGGDLMGYSIEGARAPRHGRRGGAAPRAAGRGARRQARDRRV